MTKSKWGPNEKKALKKWDEFLYCGMTANVAEEIVISFLEKSNYLEKDRKRRIVKAIFPLCRMELKDALEKLKKHRKNTDALIKDVSKKLEEE